MSRVRVWAALLAGLLVGGLIGGSTVAAATPTDPCAAAATDRAYLDCRLDRIDQALGVTPTPSPSTPSSSTSATPSVSASPTATPPTSASPSPTATTAGSWLSGASNDATMTTDQFGTWRGGPTEIVGTWINDPAAYPFGPKINGCGGCGQYQTWTGPADVGITPANWQGWANEAAGGNDTFWRNTARKLKELRGGKGTTYVRPWYEYNGDWMPYSVPNNATDRARFVTAFQRVDAIFAADFPEAKMMLGTAAAGGANRVTVADAWPTGVDVLSIDFYNEWPWCNTQACFDTKIEDSAGSNSLADLQRLAKAKGVPIMISEWGSANHVRPASGGGGGDAPGFFTAWHAWLKANAGTGPGQVIGEVYFNIPAGYEAQFWLAKGAAGTPNPEAPAAVAAYRSLFSNT